MMTARVYCSLSAVLLCLSACVSTIDAGVVAKPGECPSTNSGEGICAEMCSNDSDCLSNEKCCSNGCGHQCMAPYTVKTAAEPLTPAVEPPNPRVTPAVEPPNPRVTPAVEPQNPRVTPAVEPPNPRVTPAVEPQNPRVTPAVEPQNPRVTPAVEPPNPRVTPAVEQPKPPVCAENGHHTHSDGQCPGPMVRAPKPFGVYKGFRQ